MLTKYQSKNLEMDNEMDNSNVNKLWPLILGIECNSRTPNSTGTSNDASTFYLSNIDKLFNLIARAKPENANKKTKNRCLRRINVQV